MSLIKIAYIEGFNGDLVTYTNLVFTKLYLFPSHVIRKSNFTLAELSEYDRIIYFGHGEKNRWIVKNHQNIYLKDLPKDKEYISIACCSDLSLDRLNSIYFDETLIGVHFLNQMYPAIRILLHYGFDSTKNLNEIYYKTVRDVSILKKKNETDSALIRFLRVIRRHNPIYGAIIK